MPEKKKTVPGPEALAPEEGTTDDGEAEKESAAITAGKLDLVAQQKEHGRRERFRDNVSLGALAIVWTWMVAIMVSIIAVGFHYLTPWGWLKPEQLPAVQTFVFSSAVVAAITGYIRKYLD